MLRSSCLLLLLVAVCSGCSSEGPPVHIVVPDGFIGEIRLVLGPTGGAEIPRANGRYTFHIPPDGTLRVKSFAPFRGWHTQTAGYANGTLIPNAVETESGPNGIPPTVGKNVVVLNGGGISIRNDGPETMSFYVGTVAEYEQDAERRR